MVEKKRISSIITAASCFALGVIIALIFTMATTEERVHWRTVIVLNDEKCDVCAVEFNKTVEALKKALSGTAVKIIELSPYAREGEIIYKKLVENNVTVLPLIVFTKDIAEPAVFSEINRAVADAGMKIELFDAGEYYILRPTWPVRKYVPGKGEARVKIYANDGFDTAALKKILFATVDNVVIAEENTRGNYLLHVDGPPQVITLLASFIPLSVHTSTSLEVPYVKASVRVVPEAAEEINAVLSRPNIIVDGFVVDENISVVAAISTDHPEIIGKLFPGGRLYPDGIVVDRSMQLFFDVYLDGVNDDNVISELYNVVVSAPNRFMVRPHYIVFPGGEGNTTERAVIEYCVFLTHGAGSWLKFVTTARKECKDITGCWEKTAGKIRLDTEKIRNCINSKEDVLRFLINDTARAGITRPSIVINSWYVWAPEKGGLREVVCSFLLSPPPNICGEVTQDGS